MKKLSMSGGNAPTSIFDDDDLDLTVENAIAGKFRNDGQTCVCTNRFYVQDGSYDEFAQRLIARVRHLSTTTSMKASSRGPLINQAAVQQSRSPWPLALIMNADHQDG
jgi:succinate-semialdehyde dehydrogenase/glutarate-semialdehyde dehydrogenase